MTLVHTLQKVYVKKLVGTIPPYPNISEVAAVCVLERAWRAALRCARMAAAVAACRGPLRIDHTLKTVYVHAPCIFQDKLQPGTYCESDVSHTGLFWFTDNGIATAKELIAGLGDVDKDMDVPVVGGTADTQEVYADGFARDGFVLIPADSSLNSFMSNGLLGVCSTLSPAYSCSMFDLFKRRFTFVWSA